MKMDILIRNGMVTDIVNGTFKMTDIAISNGKIVAIGKDVASKGQMVLDADGCIVTPGLIDYHLHLFQDASDHGVFPDSALLPNGVTTAVDAGTSGVSTYAAFRRTVVDCTQVRVKAFLNISPIGMLNDRQHENLNPKYFDVRRLKELFDVYSQELLGLKLRLSLDVDPHMGEDTLFKTLEIAEHLKKRLVVHVTNPVINIEKLAMALRPGDVFCHMYQGKGQTILDENGKIRLGIQRARAKGVLFDACNGRSNYDTDVAIEAMKQNFIPDIISTDLTASTLYLHPVISLPFVLSKYLNMGMELIEVIRRCTSVPAVLLGMENEIGKLQEGYTADIAIFKLKKKRVCFTDYLGKRMEGNQVLVPQLTLKDGVITYRQSDF